MRDILDLESRAKHMRNLLQEIIRLEHIEPDNDQHDMIIEFEINRKWHEWSEMHRQLLES